MFSWILSLATVLLCLSPIIADGAPLTCSYACPSTDDNGYTLITSPYAIPNEGPYSVFSCVYSIPRTSTEPHTCHYYKTSGLHALGPATGSGCPAQAAPCSEGETPKFSVPEKVEKIPWVENGGTLMWYKMNHPTS